MTIGTKTFKKALMGTAACLALSMSVSAVQAGGLAVREQSTQFLGSAFAGNAAGGGLSSSFWNPATLGEAGHGISNEANVTAILPNLEVTPTGGKAALAFPGQGSETFNDAAFLSSSYTAYRWNENLVFGVAIGSPFGLGSKVSNPKWAGQLHHQSAKLETPNLTAMASVRVMPGLMVGFGPQFQYAKLKFKTGTGGPTDNLSLTGTDLGIGFTAGLLWKPTQGTSIGLGFRSAVAHSIRGNIKSPTVAAINNKRFSLDLDTPEMLTLSVRQSLSPNMRVLGTVEWTKWSRLDVHPVYAQLGPVALQFANFDFQYEDGWFFALGGEYDVSNSLTLRAGAAYEISPVQKATQRLVQIADSDRVWLSAGASYKWSDSLSFDLGYSHIFFDDAKIDRTPAGTSASAQSFQLLADTTNSADIISIGVKYKLGGH